VSLRQIVPTTIALGALLTATPIPAATDTPPANVALEAPPAAALSARPADTVFEYNATGKRDPFRPLALDRKTVATAEPLSPLQHYDIGQLKLVGLIYNTNPPLAMVEDSAGLGFIISPGTPVGANGGVVTVIRPRQVVVEEWYNDVIGDKHKREIVLELPNDQTDTQSEPRTVEAKK